MRNHVINSSIPILFIGLTAFGKLMSGYAHFEVAFPISIGLSIHPLGFVVAFSQVLSQGAPWPYTDLWPA